MIRTIYQDIWIRGRTVFYGDRECEHRYVPIKGLLIRLSKPCRVLDFGAGCGYFGFRVAYDFPESQVVLVDSNRLLPKIAEKNSLPNVKIVNRKVNYKELESLGSFDVAIAYSVLHHLDDWEKYLNVLLNMADYLLIENPQVNEHIHTYRRETANQIYAKLSKMGNATVVCYTPPRRFCSPIDFTGAKPRPTFLIKNKPLPPPKPIKLKIDSGEGASFNTYQFWETTDWSPLGFKPYRGTLNLVGEESSVLVTWNNKVELNVTWGRRKEENWRYWEWLIAWKTRLNGETVYSFPTHGFKIEVVAPFHIKSRFNLKNGDYVELSPQ